MKSRFNGSMLLLMLGCAILFCMLQSSFSAWFLLYSISLIAVYSLLSLVLSLGKVEVDRVITPVRCKCGDELTVTVRLKLYSPLPVAWLAVQDHWRHEGAGWEGTHRKLLFPWFRAEQVYQYRIPSIERGKFHFYELELTTGDPFGLFVRTKRKPVSSRVIVYPQPRQVNWAISRQNRFSGNAYSSFPSLAAAPIVGGVREYVSGDPIRRIHWKASARTQSLKTKELESNAESSRMIVLDASYTSYGDLSVPGTFETCVQLAAGLYEYASKRNCAAGLVCNDLQQSRLDLAQHVDLPAGCDLLAGVVHNGLISLPEVLVREAALLPSGGMLVCITSKLDENLCQCIKKLRMKGTMVSLVYVHEFAAISPQPRRWLGQLELLGCDLVTVSSNQVIPRKGERGAVDVSA